MRNWFYKLSRGKQIVVAVLLAHIGCLLFLSADYLLSRREPKRRKVVVNMVTIAPQKKQTPSPSQAAPAPKKNTPKPPVAKKQPEKTPPAKSQTIKETPHPISSTTTLAQATLLKDIEASLETIANPPPPTPPKNAMIIPILAEIIRETTHEGASDEIIAAFLQETLTLPDFGDVRVSISIDRLGHLKSLEILAAKSEKNAAFLKNRLPELQYPCLNEEASMTVLFSNAL